MRPLTPPPEYEFVDGPSVEDTEALCAWLQTHDGDRRQLRLPVSMEDLGVAVENFLVGCVAIDVDDTALGVSLADRVHAKSEGQTRCKLWLEGYWSSGTLHLRRVGERVDDEAVHAKIQADEPEANSRA